MVVILCLIALLCAAVIFGGFFLLFKVIWLILRKDKNKWPLILSGVSTVAFIVLLGGFTAWGAYKVISPFQDVIAQFRNAKAPVYGEHVYTDPVYGFTLDTYDGMTFSKWMRWDDVDVKIGIDTNLAFGQNGQQPSSENINLAVLIREPHVSQNEPFEEVEELLQEAQRRGQVTLNTSQYNLDNGQQSFYNAGLMTNTARNQSFPFWMTSVVQGTQVYTVITTTMGSNASLMEATAKSLRFTAAAALPAPAKTVTEEITVETIPVPAQ